MATSPIRIGDFDVIRQLGSGGMGDVYLARDSRLDRQVAIKVVRGEVRDQAALDRFFREARAAAALRHPNIVTIYASGQHDRQPYMVMEFVDGESLSDVIRQRRNLMLSDRLSYLEQICSGLHYAHLAGIVHRDVKPANIMVDRQGVVRILDFGIARIEGSAMTLDGTMVGSLNYMSPEQMLGKVVDPRSDMFSLGSVAYELLCYQQAFRGSMNDGLLQRLPNEDPPPLSSVRKDLPAELEQIIAKALQKSPDLRYPDLEAMRDAILEVKRGLGQDDVRTIVVRPRGRNATDATPAPRNTAATKPATSWGETTAESSDTASGRPAWATPLPTRVVRSGSQSGDSHQATPTPIPARPSTTTTSRRSSSTTRSPLGYSPLPLPLAEPPSLGRGILVGSILGICVIAALSAVSWTRTPPPSPLERERPAINEALERFRSAYRTRDMAAMLLVFPTIPSQAESAMQRTFNTCLVYEVTYDGVRVGMDPGDETLATADVRSSHTCTPKSGGRESTTDKHDLISLRKDGDTWLVDGTSQAPPTAARGPRPARQTR
ncbi:MAG: serine/threonine protein kinase [Acidobacteria bacterium]|nr:serine/threonine protein kinase [Acidobacteriota bacterium]